MRFGWPEIVIILVIVLIIFGVGKLPQIGGAIGKSIREFRKSSTGDAEDKNKLESKSAPQEPAAKS
jgi:sec-independent protein translocase protein TatA